MIKAIIVGAGDRSDVYASYALREPDKLKIVGITDPDPVRLDYMKKKYSVPESNCFESVDELLKREKFADAVINGTMDQIHVQTSVPVLEKGYDLLLEKPFAVNEEEMRRLVQTAGKYNRLVYICHVLRYTPFYSAIKKHIMSGEIGKIITIEMNEHVSYQHMAVSYVRGKWRSELSCGAPMLLAKSCHDIDLMMWMMKETKPVSVVSYGSDFQFGKGRKPGNAGTRCMKDCPVNDKCVFSCKSAYMDVPDRWSQYVWTCLGNEGNVSEERKAESLINDNIYGKCVWDFDRGDNVDHQSVIVNFANGATGSFNMVGGSSKSERNIHVIGTRGEIKGIFEDQKFTVRHMTPSNEQIYSETEYDMNIVGDMIGEKGGHGGGDERLIEDFVAVLEGREPSISCTDINDSTISHLVVFKAEEARKKGCVVSIDAGNI